MYDQGGKGAQGLIPNPEPKRKMAQKQGLSRQITMTHYRDCKDHSTDIRGLSLLLAMCNRRGKEDRKKERERRGEEKRKEEKRNVLLCYKYKRGSLLGVNKGPHQTGSAMETKLHWWNAGS